MAIRGAGGAGPGGRWRAAALAGLVATGLGGCADRPRGDAGVEIDWRGEALEDLSGVAAVGRFLVVCNDEARHSAHVLEARGGGYAYHGAVRLTAGGRELDLEGVAADGAVVYVVGSHGRDADGDPAPAREQLFRFELGGDGGLKGEVAATSLRGAVARFPVLEAAGPRKPKAGGLDVEGIAARDGWLYAGLRGPLGPGGEARVLKFQFEDPTATAELLAVGFGGLGVRDLARVADGLLVVAGPSGDAAGPFRLYYWDGGAGAARLLCGIPTSAGARAEGLAVLEEDAGGYDLLVLYDGPRGGEPTRLRVPR